NRPSPHRCRHCFYVDQKFTVVSPTVGRREEDHAVVSRYGKAKRANTDGRTKQIRGGSRNQIRLKM
ncbi:unnamed protein product, partial [Arabidopsis halleri]